MMVPSGRLYITPEIFNIVEAEQKSWFVDVSPFSRGVCSGYMLVFGGVAGIPVFGEDFDGAWRIIPGLVSGL